MALKKELDHADWEKLPDWVQSEYGEEKDGKHLKKEAPADPGASKDKERLETIRRTADANARKAETLQAIVDKLPKGEDGEPLDPDRLIEILEAYEETKTSAAKVPDKLKEAVDKAVADARRKWDKDKGTLERERDEERLANHELLVMNTIKGWVGANIHPDYQEEIEDSLIARLKPEVRREVVDGKPVRKAVTKAEGYDEDLLTHLDEKWKITDKAKRYLRSPDNSGGDKGDGATPRPENTSATITAKSQFKSNKERSDFIDKNGEEAYTKLPA